MNDEHFWIPAFRSFLRSSNDHDPAHDLSHIERVVVNTRQLASAEGLTLEVLLPAAYLHDCLHVAKNSPDRSRASTLSADRANRFLTEVNYPAIHLGSIHHAICAHSFSAGITPRTLEARVLQDADRLDALGAVGLGRCLMLGGHFGSSLYHPEDPFCEKRKPEDSRFCLDHFYAKLLTLADTMQTETEDFSQNRGRTFSAPTSRSSKGKSNQIREPLDSSYKISPLFSSSRLAGGSTVSQTPNNC